MNFQDWQVLERLDCIRNNYAEAGTAVVVDPHTLTLLVGPIDGAAATTIDDRFTRRLDMPDDAHFVWTALAATYAETQQARLDRIAAIMMRFTIGQTDSYLGDQSLIGEANMRDGWVPIVNCAGRIRSAFPLPFPIFFRRGDFMDLDFQSPLGSGPAGRGPDVTLTFIGFKLHRSPGVE